MFLDSKRGASSWAKKFLADIVLSVRDEPHQLQVILCLTNKIDNAIATNHEQQHCVCLLCLKDRMPACNAMHESVSFISSKQLVCM